MFKNTEFFAGFSVNDLQEAREFYGQTLGLEVSGADDFLELKAPGGGKVLIYPKDNHVPATFTVLNFPVDDLEQAMDQLTGRGVKFEIYTEGDIATDARGICAGDGMRVAWFKDPAGNFIALLEE